MAYANHMASLKAAAEDKTNPAVSKTTQFAIDPRALEVEEGFNARPLNADHVAEMSLALRNGATFPPLDVRVDDGRILIVDGHHRHAAALDAIAKGFEIKVLDCRQFRGNDADRVAHMLNSASGLALTPLQLGVQYRKLIGFGWTEKQIADRRGKSVQHVKDMVLLGEANSDVHQAVNAGQISGTAALKIVKEHGSKAGAVIKEGVEAAQAAGKTKVTPKALAKGKSSKVSDKQLLEWLLANGQVEPFGVVTDTRDFSITISVPASAGDTTDLRALLTAAAGHQ
ncbi:chromosome partitioning protein, ParB family [Massilia yuzhufengensis]|uniref:Chromosome partitioning protein, ParB family n=2 Tax=Massilia yuzhufengensis TaxID=1164594 RepID=A0A1I1VMS0_9BURK|nr:chromosome partitioning protein, ParB family [Massilia yuzhufengensis]